MLRDRGVHRLGLGSHWRSKSYLTVVAGFLAYYGQHLLLWEIMRRAIGGPVVAITQFLLLCGALAGVLLWRTLSTRSCRERAALATREAVESALATECGQIARELHDTVGHGLAIISLSARRSGLDRPDADLRMIDDTAHNAIQELSRVLGRLSLGGGADSGADGHRRQLGRAINAAVDVVTPLGLPVRLSVHRVEIDLLAPVCRIAERVVRESLLNIIKHMPDATAEVSVVVGQHIELTIRGQRRRRPDRAHRPNRPRFTGSGRGVQGLKDQLGMYGGSLSLTIGTGFSLVQACIPLVLYSDPGAERALRVPAGTGQSHHHGGKCHAVGVS